MSQNDSSNWDTSYEWKIILLLSLTFGLVGLDRFILPVILQDPNSTMGVDLGLTPEDGGVLAGYLGMAWGISAFVMGYMADKLGRRAVLVPAILIFSLMSAFSGMATSIMMLVIVRVIMGLAEGPVASNRCCSSSGSIEAITHGFKQRYLPMHDLTVWLGTGAFYRLTTVSYL